MGAKKTGQAAAPRIAFQGEHGAFSSEAARRLFDGEISLAPTTTFEKMFAAVENGMCEYCVAPIENSLFGSVYQNYDLLLKHHLRIVGETSLRIVHNLIAAPGTKIDDIKRVYSHQVALGQCLNFFVAHPETQAVAAYDTAGSVKMIMESREPGVGAIASVAAAEHYQAEVLMEGIEDDPQNYTRFLLLSQQDENTPPPETADKTSIVFTLEHKTGSLHRAMAAFALREIDLTKIESRPLIGYPWEYSFYLDFIGNTAEPRVRNALAHLGEFASDIRILGCYKRSPKQQ
jgi:prephenate dehydratase